MDPQNRLCYFKDNQEIHYGLFLHPMHRAKYPFR